ncbi:ATP-binding protein [Candidatus Frankia alpina]|uniref:ATP-binding protein n=1 Tax=Candidatus Frankia alpina TaxID=2699483 RepID=UPI001F298987|nr:ATP-binding protein [Candidatus Frankia alpina]
MANPGGLYGITVDRLGRDAVTSARNARLVAICQHVRTPQTADRVIEALASGIPTVTEAPAWPGSPATRCTAPCSPSHHAAPAPHPHRLSSQPFRGRACCGAFCTVRAGGPYKTHRSASHNGGCRAGSDGHDVSRGRVTSSRPASAHGTPSRSSRRRARL